MRRLAGQDAMKSARHALFRQRWRELRPESLDYNLSAATHTRGVWAMWAAGERPFDELFSSYRRKSFTLKLPLRTRFLSGANNFHDFNENFFLKIKPKMWECGKYVKMQHFPHDCGMVDTCVTTTNEWKKYYQLKRAAEYRKGWHGLVVNIAQETTFR